MYDPQPIRDRPVGLEFPHCAGRFRRRGSPILSQAVGVVKVWNNFQSRDGSLSFPGCVGSYMYDLQPISDRPVGLGFPHRAGRVRPAGDLCFRPRVVGVVEIWRDFLSGHKKKSSPGGAGFIFEPQPISDRPAGLGFPHHAGQFSTRGFTVFVPGMSEL